MIHNIKKDRIIKKTIVLMLNRRLDIIVGEVICSLNNQEEVKKHNLTILHH